MSKAIDDHVDLMGYTMWSTIDIVSSGTGEIEDDCSILQTVGRGQEFVVSGNLENTNYGDIIYTV